MKVPWASLTSTPIEMDIEDVNFLLEACEVSSDIVQNWERATKKSRIAKFEEQQMKGIALLDLRAPFDLLCLATLTLTCLFHLFHRQGRTPLQRAAPKGWHG